MTGGLALALGTSLTVSGSGQVVYPTTPDWESLNPHYSTGAALVDIDRDGWLDYVVADGNDILEGRLNVYYNNGDGTFPTTAGWQSGDLAYNGHLDVADVNGDGWPDVAVSYLGESSTVDAVARVYLNNSGTLSSLPDWEADVVGNAFGVDEGVVVDTHVKRLTTLMRFTKEKTPERIERDLMDTFPRERWTLLAHLLIWHGRRVCDARKPKCEACAVSHLCPSSRV